MTAFWDIAPFSFVEVYRRFRGAYWLREISLKLLWAHTTNSGPTLSLIQGKQRVTQFTRGEAVRRLRVSAVWGHTDWLETHTGWSSESSGMYCRVLNWMSTDVSEVRAASIIRAMTHCPDDGGSTNLWNVGRHSIKNTALHPRRFWASYSPPWEPEISHTGWMLLAPFSCFSVIVSFDVPNFHPSRPQ
jgi:hypothetical protein